MNAAILLMAACIPGTRPDPTAVVPHPLMPMTATLDVPLAAPGDDTPAAPPDISGEITPAATPLTSPERQRRDRTGQSDTNEDLMARPPALGAPVNDGADDAEVVPIGLRPVRPASWAPVTTAEPPLLATEAPVNAVEPVTMPVMEVQVPAAPVRGKLVVTLPPAALLFIDDQPTQAGMGENTFYTVPLPPGAARYYRLRGEVLCDGQAVGETVTAVVQAGRESWVCFPRLQIVGEPPRNEPLIATTPAGHGPPAATLGFEPVSFPSAVAPAAEPLRAKFVIEVPAGATLLVQGQAVQAVPGENTFHTPPLQAGTPYRYTVRAELSHNGQVLAEEIQLVLRGGDEARVSFPHLQMPQGVAVRWPKWR